MRELNEDTKRKVEKVVEWAQKNKIKVELLTPELVRQAIRSRS